MWNVGDRVVVERTKRPGQMHGKILEVDRAFNVAFLRIDTCPCVHEWCVEVALSRLQHEQKVR